MIREISSIDETKPTKNKAPRELSQGAIERYGAEAPTIYYNIL